MNKYKSRKFLFALLFSVTSILGLFMDKIGGGEFIAAITVILGLYGAADVAEKKVLNDT